MVNQESDMDSQRRELVFAHFCYSGEPKMIASSPLLSQNATRKRIPTP
jgi:hypothetical protein